MRCTPVLRGLGKPHHWPVSRSPPPPDDALARLATGLAVGRSPGRRTPLALMRSIPTGGATHARGGLCWDARPFGLCRPGLPCCPRAQYQNRAGVPAESKARDLSAPTSPTCSAARRRSTRIVPAPHKCGLSACKRVGVRAWVGVRARGGSLHSRSTQMRTAQLLCPQRAKCMQVVPTS